MDSARKQILGVLQAILLEECGFELELDENMTAMDVPGWDSLAHCRIVMSLENRLAIAIDMDDTFGAASVGDLVSIAEKAPLEGAAESPDADSDHNQSVSAE